MLHLIFFMNCIKGDFFGRINAGKGSKVIDHSLSDQNSHYESVILLNLFNIPVWYIKIMIKDQINKMQEKTISVQHNDALTL